MTTYRIRMIARGHAAVAVLFGLAIEGLLVAGYFDTPLRSMLLDIHYGFNVLILVVSVAVLFYAYTQTRRKSLLLGGLAATSWLLAIVFWTAYVYLQGEVITYPSIAEVGFQGFHLLIIPLGYGLLQQSDYPFYRPSLMIVPVLASIPLFNHFMKPLSLPILLYGTVYLTLIGGTTVLAVHFIFFQNFRLLGTGLGIFALGEMLYAGYVTPYIPTAQVIWLDPLWYGGLPVVAWALVRYESEGDLI